MAVSSLYIQLTYPVIQASHHISSVHTVQKSYSILQLVTKAYYFPDVWGIYGDVFS